MSFGRSYRDAPEIDGLIIMPGEVPIGKIVPVHIDGAMAYDLTGSPVLERAQPIPLDNVQITR